MISTSTRGVGQMGRGCVAPKRLSRELGVPPSAFLKLKYLGDLYLATFKDHSLNLVCIQKLFWHYLWENIGCQGPNTGSATCSTNILPTVLRSGPSWCSQPTQSQFTSGPKDLMLLGPWGCQRSSRTLWWYSGTSGIAPCSVWVTMSCWWLDRGWSIQVLRCLTGFWAIPRCA